ncbi:MAG: oxidoreductase [Ilumatobacteraceae bacterium]
MGSDTFSAFTATLTDGAVRRSVDTMSVDDLPADGVLVDVERSSVNYKDGLAATANGKVARISPLIPGIDLAGTVRASDDPAFPVGTAVIAHGYDLGVSRHGGFAQLARVPAGWLVPCPPGLDLREAMTIGTAGFTAALSVVSLEEHGLTPAAGPVLVTGATGGVGSIAVGILAARGYEVVASTGKHDAEPYLRGLGAAEVIDRSELSSEGGKPLDSMVWAAAVDCVGGRTLANVLARIRYGGAVAASGLTGGAGLDTTVLPFILRNVALLGVDSVQTPIDRRTAVWRLLGSEMKPRGLDTVARDVTLDGLGEALDTILAGGATGRAVVDLRGG